MWTCKVRSSFLETKLTPSHSFLETPLTSRKLLTFSLVACICTWIHFNFLHQPTNVKWIFLPYYSTIQNQQCQENWSEFLWLLLASAYSSLKLAYWHTKLICIFFIILPCPYVNCWHFVIFTAYSRSIVKVFILDGNCCKIKTHNSFYKGCT